MRRRGMLSVPTLGQTHGREGAGTPVRLLTMVLMNAAMMMASSALGQMREPDLQRGATLVQARCLACHGKEPLPKFVDRCTQSYGKAYLDDFLKRHHAPDDEARADIIAYLTCPPELRPTD